MVNPLEICESARGALTGGVQARAEWQSFRGTPHLMLALARLACLHSSFMYDTLPSSKRHDVGMLQGWAVEGLTVNSLSKTKCWWTFSQIDLPFLKYGCFAWLSLYICASPFLFSQACILFPARKTKDAALESGDEQNDLFAGGHTDTLTTCSRCSAGKRKMDWETECFCAGSREEPGLHQNNSPV